MCVHLCYGCYVFFFPCLNVRLVHSTEQLLWCPLYGVMKFFLCEARHYQDCPTMTNCKEPLGALQRHTPRQSERCEDATPVQM